jgi:predicted ABC-type ATPase
VPVLHLLVGPNGSGKTTFHEYLLHPATHLPFINADQIARREWPGAEEAHGHDASALAEKARNAAIAKGTSFVAETVFSHPSKLDLIARAKAAGYAVTLHVFIVPEELSVARTRLRAGQGGHTVPEDRVRARYRRLWVLVEKAIAAVDEAFVYDNSTARKPFRAVARYQSGKKLGESTLPEWSPLC